MLQPDLNRRLLDAIKLGRLDLCEALLQKGADPNATVLDSSTQKYTMLLHEAATRRQSEICRALVDHGADVNAMNDNLWAPLHRAASCGCESTVRLLVDRGANSDILGGQDGAGRTPVQCAVINGHVSIVRFFLDECRSDIDQVSGKNETLDHLAKIYDEPEVTDFLQRYRRAMQTDTAIRSALDMAVPACIQPKSLGPSPL